MFALYVFSLVVGGGFLAVAVLGDVLGGDVSDADFDVQLDADVDLDADLQLDGDVDAGDMEGDAAASKILSLRTVVYALFGFGGVGTLLSLLWQGSAPTATAALSVVGGLSSGALIHSIFAYLRRSESGQRQGESSFEGMLGRVVLPLADSSGGEIVVERGTREYRLKARAHDTATHGSPASEWTRVLVVEMRGGVALVAPDEGHLLAAPEESP